MARMGVSVESLGIEGACFFYSLQFTLPAAITAEMLQLDLEDHLYIRGLSWTLDPINPGRGEKIYSGSTCILPVAVKIDAGVVAKTKLCTNLWIRFEVAPPTSSMPLRKSVCPVFQRKSHDWNVCGSRHRFLSWSSTTMLQFSLSRS